METGDGEEPRVGQDQMVQEPLMETLFTCFNVCQRDGWSPFTILREPLQNFSLCLRSSVA